LRNLITIMLAVALAAAAALRAGPVDDRSLVAERVKRLTRESAWTAAGSVPIAFDTHHPQGMVKIRDAFYVSSVEIKERTKRFPQPVGGYDRDAGAGIGHLFKIDGNGRRIADLTLGEDTIYHPGGIDYDGTSIWVPVAEYRPDGRSIVYRYNPDTMKAT
jgi:hypothetical protein